jgi:hypothetical protein
MVDAISMAFASGQPHSKTLALKQQQLTIELSLGQSMNKDTKLTIMESFKTFSSFCGDKELKVVFFVCHWFDIIHEI